MDLSPLGACLAWSPLLVSLHVASDVLMALAFTAIPVAILIYARKKRTEYPVACYSLAGFVFWLGAMHAATAVTMFYPIPLAIGVMKAITACLTIVCAIAAFPMISAALALRTPKEYDAYARAVQQDLHQLRSELDHMTFHARTLMGELARRTQSVLSSVQALTKETAKTTSDVDMMARKINARIVGMAHCQEMLNNNAWRGANLRELVEAQLASFPALQEVVTIDGPDTYVNPQAAQQISLAVHELAANTVKHSVNGKGVEGLACAISWQAQGRSMKFNWSETREASHNVEAPLVTALPHKPPHKGFGRMILEYVVPSQMNGFSELQFGPNGEASYELETPMDTMLIAA